MHVFGFFFHHAACNIFFDSITVSVLQYLIKINHKNKGANGR